MYNFDKFGNRKNTNSIKWDMKYQEDSKMIPMWVADYDFETLPDINKALSEYTSNGVYGYTFVSDEYLESVQNWMKRRHQLQIEKEWIVPTPGVVTSLRIAIQAYTKENDAVMILRPVYYPFDFAIEESNRKKITCPLDLIGDKYELNFGKFESLIIENNVKALVLCSPHNPIGKVWSKDELNYIGEICLRHHVFVISDEIHMDFVYKPNKFISYYEVNKAFKDHSILLTAASKTFNLAGLQTSNTIIYNKELRDKYRHQMRVNGVNSPNVLGLIATKTAYQKGDQYVDELVSYIENNFKYLEHYINKELPMLKLIKPQGLYLAWIDFSQLFKSNKELETFMLKKAHLWLDEGVMFGEEGSLYERFNLATPREILEKALTQLKEAINELNTSK